MKKLIGIALMAISFLCTCAGCFLLYQKMEGYKENEEIYDHAASMAVSIPSNPEYTNDNKNAPENDSGLTENQYGGTYNGPTIDWESLKGEHVRAWIMFGKDNEIINYPVVQGNDNAYFLHHAYDGTYNANGAIFMNSNNDAAFRDMNTIIYGHNLRSGRMFGTLKRYLEKNSGRKLEFYIFTPDGKKRTYQVISVMETKDGGYAYEYAFNSVGKYREYLEHVKKDAAYDTGNNYDIGKRVVTLSTCRSVGSAQGWRVVMVAKEEKIETVQDAASWYKEPADEVVTVLDIEKGMEKTSHEISELKQKRKEDEAKDMDAADVQTESRPEGEAAEH